MTRTQQRRLLEAEDRCDLLYMRAETLRRESETVAQEAARLKRSIETERQAA